MACLPTQYSSSPWLPTDLGLRSRSSMPIRQFRGRYQFHEAFVHRLGLETELEGHEGCVNCIQWNHGGDILISGSDDRHINIWDPYRGSMIQSLETKHSGNIFSVKFLPTFHEFLLASGAADNKVHIMDVNKEETIRTFCDHIGRVKRLDVSDMDPFLVWSAAEDGIIMQMDLRAENESAHILVNLRQAIGSHAEAKCLAINPVQSEFLAVGANDPFVRIYDRRMIRPHMIPVISTNGQSNMDRSRLLSSVPHFMPVEDDYNYSGEYFVPGHLSPEWNLLRRRRRRRKSISITYITFSPNGTQLLANLGGEQIYLYSILSNEISPLGRPLELPTDVSPPLESRTLSPSVHVIKEDANKCFNEEKFSKAIAFYNKAIFRETHPVLLCNRAAALIKRKWDGDIYQAMRDCQEAIKLDPSYVKAHLRLIRCFLKMDLVDRAWNYSTFFEENFPEQADACPFLALKEDIEKKRKCPNNETPPETQSTSDDEDANIAHSEIKARKKAVDYLKTFCGHCNTTTDIKEASFLGIDGEFIAAGSDDGRFFIWEKKTTNLVRVMLGDDSIVNCIQSHPTGTLLASSGIDHVVRLWSPRPEDTNDNDRLVRDPDAVSAENQQRMNEDPFEALLHNMGFVVSGSNERQSNGPQNLSCGTS